jgi:type II secretory pathway component GspD/PulD (secretin)
LGDIPYLGSLFRSETSFKKKRRILVFLTPTLIDAAGNRLYPAPH